MAAITRRGLILPVSKLHTLATADDLNGTSDGTQEFNVSGATRVIIFQVNDGTAGTAGIDVIEVSKDGGSEWAADTTVLPIDADDSTGTIQAAGALNAAGVEPATVMGGIFKSGPYEGPTLIRCSRGAAGTGTAWVTGAPSVKMAVVGKTVSTITAEA